MITSVTLITVLAMTVERNKSKNEKQRYKKFHLTNTKKCLDYSYFHLFYAVECADEIYEFIYNLHLVYDPFQAQFSEMLPFSIKANQFWPH